jgi:hypothetical protein
MVSDLPHLRQTAKRLERNARRVRELIWTGERTYLIEALAASAEVSENARRFWLQLQAHLAQPSSTTPGRIAPEQRQPQGDDV